MQFIEPSTPEDFANYYEMRWQILRAPLGLPRGSEKDSLEEVSYHLIAKDADDTFVGVAKFKPFSDTVAQISHIAVDESRRAQGVGRKLVERLEQEAQSRGYLEVFLTARDYNIPYFEKLGYKLGDEEVENNPLPDIKIFKMHKVLG